MIPLSNESMFTSGVLDRDHFPISPGVRVESSTSAISIHSLPLLEPVVSLEVEIDGPIVIQGTSVS